MQQADDAFIIANQFGDLAVLAHPPAKMLKALRHLGTESIVFPQLPDAHRDIAPRCDVARASPARGDVGPHRARLARHRHVFSGEGLM
jgi:hypothetical protein